MIYTRITPLNIPLRQSVYFILRYSRTSSSGLESKAASPRYEFPTIWICRTLTYFLYEV